MCFRVVCLNSYTNMFTFTQRHFCLKLSWKNESLVNFKDLMKVRLEMIIYTLIKHLKPWSSKSAEELKLITWEALSGKLATPSVKHLHWLNYSSQRLNFNDRYKTQYQWSWICVCVCCVIEIITLIDTSTMLVELALIRRKLANQVKYLHFMFASNRKYTFSLYAHKQNHISNQSQLVQVKTWQIWTSFGNDSICGSANTATVHSLHCC